MKEVVHEYLYIRSYIYRYIYIYIYICTPFVLSEYHLFFNICSSVVPTCQRVLNRHTSAYKMSWQVEDWMSPDPTQISKLESALKLRLKSEDSRQGNWGRGEGHVYSYIWTYVYSHSDIYEPF